MKLRSWIFVLLLIFSAYGCLLIIAAHYGWHLPAFQYHSYWYLTNAAPWVAVLGGFIAWRRVWKWRVMSNDKLNASQLSRGSHLLTLAKERPDKMEYLASLLIRIGILSLPYYFRASQPEWICATIFMIWWVLKACFAGLKKSA